MNDRSFTVASTIAAGATVGTITGADSDAGETLSYFITNGNDTGAFAIETSSGEITVLNQGAFQNLTFLVSLTVEARDTGDPFKNIQGTDTAVVTIILDGSPFVTGEILFLLTPGTATHHMGDVPRAVGSQSSVRPWCGSAGFVV